MDNRVPPLKLDSRNNHIMISASRRSLIPHQSSIESLLVKLPRRTHNEAVESLLKRPKRMRVSNSHSLLPNNLNSKIPPIENQDTPKFLEIKHIEITERDYKENPEVILKDINEFTFAKGREKYDLKSDRTRTNTSKKYIEILKMPFAKYNIKKIPKVKSNFIAVPHINQQNKQFLRKSSQKPIELIRPSNFRVKRKSLNISKLRSRCQSVMRFPINRLEVMECEINKVGRMLKHSRRRILTKTGSKPKMDQRLNI